MQPSTTNNDPEHVFAEHVRRYRERHGMTQAELAGAVAKHGIKLDASAVARMERGERGVKLAEAVAISEILEVGLTDMVVSSEPASPDRVAYMRYLMDQIRVVDEQLDDLLDLVDATRQKRSALDDELAAMTARESES